MKRYLSSLTLGVALALSVPAFAQEHGEGNQGEHATAHHGPVEGFSAPHAPFNLLNPSPAPVVDAQGTSHPGPPPFVGPIVNFAILLVLGYMAMRRSINPSLAARRAAIETEIAEAQRMHTEAEAMNREYTEKLRQLDDEIARMKAEFVKAGEAERDRVIAEAQAKAERMRADARNAIEQEMKSLREELRREAVLAAVGAAEETVRRTITAADQSRLADDYINGLDREAQEARA